MGTELVAVSVDPVADNKRVVEELGLEFPILADESRSVITDYGVLHVGGGIGGRNIARPAVFLIDADGTVTWRYLTENWRIRLRPEELIAVARDRGLSLDSGTDPSRGSDGGR